MADNKLFAGISAGERERLNDLAREVRVGAGTNIVEQGEIGREFILIVEGAADVVHDGEVVASLASGDFFGEMALLGLGEEVYHRSASVIATTDSILEVMSSFEFDATVGNFPEAADAIRQTALARRAANETDQE